MRALIALSTSSLGALAEDVNATQYRALVVLGHALGETDSPLGYLAVSILRDRKLVEAEPHVRLRAGDQVSVLVPADVRVPVGSE